ncbi:DUF1214 domain-containing protein [Aliivibrio fischeri]|nr:DUF1214 domain-containing protein [Aliivibrio fischeri]MUK28611.1 DUF1214 domain-containing protein [Aliivibrio fischeri]
MMKKALMTTLIASSILSSTCVFSAQLTPVNPQEELAYNLGLQAFIYGAGPLTVAQVRAASTNVDAPMDNGSAPLNMMGKTLKLAGPEDRVVPTVNNDTLYSQSHINLNDTGPLVIEIPPTNNRYFIVQLLDDYSEAVGNLIEDNVGQDGGKFLLANKGWKGVEGGIPDGIDGVIESRTPLVWYIQRTGVSGNKDLAAALKIHDGFINYPLSELGKSHKPVQLTHAKTGISPVPQPKGLGWFSLIDKELRNNPIASDASIVDQFKYIDIGGDEPFNPDKLTEDQKKGLMRALNAAPQIIQYASRDLGTKNNGWAMMYEGGRYGNDFLSRASINFRAAGLNTKERALYPNRYTDSDDQQLSGKNKYRMTMPADAPAKAFWSLTMYDAKNLFMVPNSIDRYSISTNREDELIYNKDGSLTVCIQNTKPTDTNCNWLPAPKDDFYLHMRLYEPTQAVLDNTYALPQVIKQ